MKNDVFNTYKHPPVVTGGQQKKENKIAHKHCKCPVVMHSDAESIRYGPVAQQTLD